jgi:hypothetical protein
MKNIAFYIEDFNIRGTSVALYDYANYNERILKNKSYIFTIDNYTGDFSAFKKFHNRFPIIFTKDIDDLDQKTQQNNISFLYTLSYGRKQDSLKYCSINIPVGIHCVFDMSEPHGSKYVGVSKSLANKFQNHNFVNHMISHYPSKNNNDLRSKLNIPKDAIVFGRYGGTDTFNLTWSFDIIKQIVDTFPNFYFIFMNTPFPYKHPQIIHVPSTIDIDEKNEFIKTCNAHIVFETLGHSFGMACAEFSINNIPSIIYNGKVWNTSHIDIQGDEAIYFNQSQQLYDILINFDINKKYNLNAYNYYNPYNIMHEFNNQFLSNI